jgi:hypothetical protein
MPAASKWLRQRMFPATVTSAVKVCRHLVLFSTFPAPRQNRQLG